MELFGSRYGRRNDVVVMTLINLSGLLLCVLTAAFPAHPESPVGLAWLCAAFAAIVAGIVWNAGVRWPDATIRAALIVHVLAATMMITVTASAQGAMNATFANLWIAVYVAAFFPISHARVTAVLIAALFGIAFILHPAMHGTINWHSWIAVGGTTIVGTEVLARLIRRLKSLTTIDPLTGAYNRLGFDLQLRQVQAAAARRDEPLTLAMLDLDDFKGFNDRQGHTAGDALLSTIVDAWKTNARPDDVIGRYGGDEFVCLIHGTPLQATRLLDRLDEVTEGSWTAGIKPLGHDEPLAVGIARADEQMYANKRARRPA